MPHKKFLNLHPPGIDCQAISTVALVRRDTCTGTSYQSIFRLEQEKEKGPSFGVGIVTVVYGCRQYNTLVRISILGDIVPQILDAFQFCHK